MSEIVLNVRNIVKRYKLYNSEKERLKEAFHPLHKSYHKDSAGLLRRFSCFTCTNPFLSIKYFSFSALLYLFKREKVCYNKKNKFSLGSL